MYDIDKSKSIYVKENIIYKHTEHKFLPMDVYRPSGISKDSKLPAIVFFTWRGSRKTCWKCKGLELICFLR